MSFSQQQLLAERLVTFIGTCPELPIKGGSLTLDKLRAEGRAMSLHFLPGQVVKGYANGRKVIRQPFAVSYRAASTDDDEIKSAMIGAINSIGRWLENIDRHTLNLGPGVNITKLEQATWASILEQSEGNLAYMGDFILEYNQRTSSSA